jgi:DNA-binding NtrC family response regulator
VLPPKLDPETPPSGPGVTLEYGLTLEEVERRYLRAVLSENSRELGELAEDLGISRKTLWEKRRRYAL